MEIFSSIVHKTELITFCSLIEDNGISKFLNVPPEISLNVDPLELLMMYLIFNFSQ